VRADSPDGDRDLLPGLCAFATAWLANAALPAFRDTAGAPPPDSLTGYYEVPPRAGPRALSPGARAGRRRPSFWVPLCRGAVLISCNCIGSMHALLRVRRPVRLCTAGSAYARWYKVGYPLCPPTRTYPTLARVGQTRHELPEPERRGGGRAARTRRTRLFRRRGRRSPPGRPAAAAPAGALGRAGRQRRRAEAGAAVRPVRAPAAARVAAGSAGGGAQSGARRGPRGRADGRRRAAAWRGGGGGRTCAHRRARGRAA